MEKRRVILPTKATPFGKDHVFDKAKFGDWNQTGGICVNVRQMAILSNNGPSPWLKRVSEVLGTLGTVHVFTEQMLEAEAETEAEAEDPYEVFLVDASGLQMDLAERVGWLHGRFPETPIIVLTSSPTWRRARAVLQAGAADYMRRSMTDDALLERCRSLLSWPP